MSIQDEFKEHMRQATLKAYGTLDETGDHYSFEEGFARFEKALSLCWDPKVVAEHQANLAARKSRVKSKAKR